jgi:nitrite reductase/ring-hydroxylating ferredoxin subunit
MFTEVAELSELREDKKKLVVVNDKPILLVFDSGDVFAINAVCPHQGGDLSCAKIIDEEVVCPNHAFGFNYKDGICLQFPNYRVKTYKVKVENHIVSVEV